MKRETKKKDASAMDTTLWWHHAKDKLAVTWKNYDLPLAKRSLSRAFPLIADQHSTAVPDK
jgi:hypothetical protein